MLHDGTRPEATPLVVAVETTDPAAPIVTVRGDLDFETAHALHGEIERQLAARPSVLVLDFAGLRFMDSNGLAVIVRAWQQSSRFGTVLRLRSKPRFLDTILDITGVSSLLARQYRADRPDRPAASA